MQRTLGHVWALDAVAMWRRAGEAALGCKRASEATVAHIYERGRVNQALRLLLSGLAPRLRGALARVVPSRARLATSLVVLIALMWTSFLGSVAPLARAASADAECCCCEPRADEAGDSDGAHERLERERASMDCCEAPPPAAPASPAIVERAPHDEDALAATVPVADTLAGLRPSRVELGACGARGPPPARREPLFIWHCSVLL